MPIFRFTVSVAHGMPSSIHVPDGGGDVETDVEKPSKSAPADPAQAADGRRGEIPADPALGADGGRDEHHEHEIDEEFVDDLPPNHYLTL